MALEPFLINPVRRKRRTVKRRRTGRSGLPGGLLRKYIKMYGPAKGMKEAWKAHRSGKSANPWPGHPAEHRRASGRGWSKRKRRISGRAKPRGAHYPRWKNPLGEEIIVVGANPRRKRKRKEVQPMARRRRRSVRRRVRRNVLVNRRRPVRRHRRRRATLWANPRRVRRHRRRRATFMANPRRRRSYRRKRRSYRRNPAMSIAGISLRRPMSLVMPIATGIMAKIAVDRIPAMVGITTPLPKAGVQLAVAFGGGMLLRKFIGSANANIWVLIGAISVATDLLNTYVLKGMLSGMGAFPYNPIIRRQIGAYPGSVAMSEEPVYPYEGIVEY